MRRRLPQLAVILIALLLLGSACTKPTKPVQSSPPAAETGRLFYGGWPYEPRPKSHFNVFAPGNLSMPGSPFTDLISSPLALYEWASNTYHPHLAEEWQVEPAIVTVTLRPDVRWSDGSTLTAEDVLTTLSIYRAKDAPVWRYISRAELIDERTIAFHLSNPATIALRYVLRMAPQPHSVYGGWADRFDELHAQGKGPSSLEMQTLLEQFDQFRPEEYVASGPFVLHPENVTASQLTLVRRADAWNAALIGFDKIIIHNGESATIAPLVLKQKVDFATHAFPPVTEQQMIAKGLRILRYPFYNGPGIFFNHDLYPFSRKEFRQALAYAVNRAEVGSAALGDSGVAVRRMAGMSDNFIATWMNPSDAARLNPYSHDLQRAAELLQSIGFTRGADGIWLDDTGKRLEFELHAPADFNDWQAAAQALVKQLNAFGIKTTLQSIPWSQYATALNRGEFQFGLLSWGSAMAHPQFSFMAGLVNFNAGGRTHDKENPGMNFPLQQEYSGGKIDFDLLIYESGKGMEVARQKAVIGKVALAYNELLPVIQLFERYANNPVLADLRVTGWPADDDPILANAGGDSFVTHLILTGKLRAAP